MRTPTQLIPRLALPLRRLRNPGGWFACVAVAAVVALEVVGRRTTTELHDGLALLVVAVLITLGYSVHGERALAWAKPAWRSVRSAGTWLTRRRFDMEDALRSQNRAWDTYRAVGSGPLAGYGPRTNRIGIA